MANQRARLAATDQLEARTWLAGLVCRTFPCRFVTLGLTPAPDQGDPNTIKHKMRQKTHFNGFLGPFRPNLVLSRVKIFLVNVKRFVVHPALYGK